MFEDLSKTNLKTYFYDIILDSSIFHIFSNEDRQRYIKNVEYLIKPGGLYIQLCFSEKETREDGSRRVNKSHLYKLFSPRNGLTIESIEDSIYQLISGILFDTDDRAYLSLIRRNNTSF
jgi:cyclopropane fatty-acyl-phospholipid synthase-like methyltransferase